MKKIITIALVAFYAMCNITYAQNVVNVTPNEINSLLNAVVAAQAGDIFVLQRDGFYFNQGNITISVPITIRASEGTGKRPLVQQAPKDDATYDGQIFQVSANTIFENLHINGFNTSRKDGTGRGIRLGADDLKLTVDGCVFERFWLRTIDLNAQNGSVIKYMNSIHLWDGREDRIDNGRFIDTRGSSMDSLIVVNNTFLNCNDRFIRNMGLPGILNYVKFDHNTFYGNIGYRPAFQFRTTKKLVFTNNIVANVGLLGTDTLSNRTDEIGYTEPFAICVFTITGTDTLGTTIDMKKNIVYNESRFTNLFTANPTNVQQAPWFNKQWEDLITVSEAVSNEELSFVKAPSLDSLVAELANYIAGGTNWSNTGFITRTEVLTPEEVNMSYGTTAAAYTGADGGFPIGDLNWYPTKKVEWQNWLATDVSTISNNIPKSFNLAQNYPNPFNPTTNIQFSIPVAGDYTLKIYNLLGQEVATLLNQQVNAGTHVVNFDASELTSGVYAYSINGSNFNQTKKMILLK